MSDQEPKDDAKPEEEPVSGINDLFYALSEALLHGKTKDAIASLIQRFADEVPNRAKASRLVFLLGHSVTFFVVIAVGVLGYLKVISGETTGVILAAIVGHLYRDRRR